MEEADNNQPEPEQTTFSSLTINALEVFEKNGDDNDSMPELVSSIPSTECNAVRLEEVESSDEEFDDMKDEVEWEPDGEDQGKEALEG